MTFTGLDFKNPLGIDTFNCFIKVFIIKRNMNESDPAPEESTYKVQQQELDSSGDESEPTIYTMSAPIQKTWKPPSGLNFPIPLESSHGLKIFHPAPSIDSQTGLRVQCQYCIESSIYLIQNLRVGDSNCLPFFDPGENAHLIDCQLAKNEEFQLISSKSTALGVIGRGSIMTE